MVDRKQVKIIRDMKKDIPCAVILSPAESLGMMWDLTKEVYSLSGKYDVESRLQRHIVRVIKK